MTYSYQNPTTYETYTPVKYDSAYYVNEQKTSSAAFPTLAGAVVGGTVGGVVGYKGHPYMSNNLPKDSFTKKAYAKYVEKVAGSEKTIHTQGKEILKKIEKVKTVDELKSLLQNQQDAAKEALGHSYDDIINNLSETNLGQNKKTIKTAIKTQQENKIQKMKNWIQTCWDAKNKKFEKTTGMADDVFSSIKKSAEKFKFTNMGKGILIGATTTGLVGFIASKIIQAKKQQ